MSYMPNDAGQVSRKERVAAVACERQWRLPEDRNRLTRKQIADLFLAQDGKCKICGQRLLVKGHLPVEFIDEHLDPLSMGGTNDLSNRALVCKPCAKVKTSAEAPIRAKSNRIRDKHIGAMKTKSRPMLGTRASGLRKRWNGTVESW